MSRGSHHRIVIVGGGTAGLTVAARLARKLKRPDIAVIEPSAKHYYQPLWTLVGGGVFPKQASERDEADFIPKGATWVRDAVDGFRPDENSVTTRGGREIGYDYLVVAPGIQIDWGAVEGLKEHLGSHGVCSNYHYRTVDYTWECIRSFRGGTALFTNPSTPVKCGGAPQKIMYLADDRFRRAGVRDGARVAFASAAGSIFAVEKYARTLEGVIARRGIETLFGHDLIAVRPEAKEAVFRRTASGDEVVLAYDMIHVTPPMSAPDFIKRSPLADAAGWVDVDKHTLRHVRYPNVFGLGDASNLPTSKTGAAVRKQAPVVVTNLASAMRGEPPVARYDGYTSCPLVTGYGKLVLAEFDYDKNSQETFPLDQSEERLSMYLLKKYGLPAFYWHGMLRGRL
ncbi:MAG: pyridine nucleotide-disulfide oxidoreductase [Planctomycetales bacterium 71-10]|nr:MAG: pyridine nucleotide-disulfide oxidoreductase [Planctomycetales bacterium 71-10]